LFGELKSLRYQLAIEEQSPAYTIFNDNTLVEMAEEMYDVASK